MDPRFVEPEQWDRIGRALVSLSAFVALATNAGLAFLLSHAIVPPLFATTSTATGARTLRTVLYPIAALSLLLALGALGYALVLAVGVLRQLYPRFLI